MCPHTRPEVNVLSLPEIPVSMQDLYWEMIMVEDINEACWNFLRREKDIFKYLVLLLKGGPGATQSGIDIMKPICNYCT